MLFNICFKNKFRINYLICLAVFILSSCAPNRNLVYFSDLGDKKEYSEKIANLNEPKIQPDDLLSILVTSLSPEANALFNRGAMPGIGGKNTSSQGAAYAQGNNFNESYLVDKNGIIDFPVLGKVTVGGLTLNQAKEMLTQRLQQYLKDPIIYVRLLNFKVTVIGEVNNPSTFTIPSEKINVLEALGLAGDMTPFGRRETVLIYREEAGTRTMARINLNSREVISSPYFYLQQNDVVYVEPHEILQSKTSNADRNARIAQLTISAA